MSGGRFAGRVMLVTGGSSGIGRACATAIGAEGGTVVIGGRREARLRETAERIVASGGQAHVVTGDVRDAVVGPAWVEAAVGRFGGLDGLVNTAGVIGNGAIADGAIEEWDRVMDANLRSVYLVTRAAFPELVKRKGAIVNIGSVASTRPYPNLGAYCVSKAGVRMFTQVLALEGAPHGVRANAIEPGVVVTELHTVTNAVPDYEGFLERSKATHPIGRVGNVEEVAQLVLYLLSDAASWITGASIPIDGGRALMSAR